MCGAASCGGAEERLAGGDFSGVWVLEQVFELRVAAKHNALEREHANQRGATVWEVET